MRRSIIYPEGHLFGTTAYLRDVEKKNGSRRAWFKCKCGKEYISYLNGVKRYKTGCGCVALALFNEKLAGGYRTRTHGETIGRRPGKEYRAWQAMRKRCSDPKYPFYKNYGGRGIAVCERWSKFEPFLEDLGRSPSPKHSLDRINVNGNYEPSNCRWATSREQALNKTNNHVVSLKGVTMPLLEWAQLADIPYARLRGRVKRGWDFHSALIAPVAKRYLHRASLHK